MIAGRIRETNKYKCLPISAQLSQLFRCFEQHTRGYESMKRKNAVNYDHSLITAHLRDAAETYCTRDSF